MARPSYLPQDRVGSLRAVPKHRRHAAISTELAASAGPSLVEVGVYGVLAALVAGGVLLVAGHPAWQAGLIVAGALVLLAVLAVVSPRSSSRPEEPAPASSTPSKHGRRRCR